MPDRDATERPERLAMLGDAMQPPPDLEPRVIRSLVDRGLLRPSPWRRSALAAAAAAVIVGAFALGRMTGAPAKPADPRWLLLLYEDQAFEAPAPGAEAARVAEYRAWARATPGVIDGAELGPDGHLLASGGTAGPAPTSPEGLGNLSGYFIVAATGWEQARAIAACCPHLEHRGRVVVRPLVAE